MQLVEEYEVNALQLNQSADDMMYVRQQVQPPGDAFFHPLDCEPTPYKLGKYSSSNSLQIHTYIHPFIF